MSRARQHKVEEFEALFRSSVRPHVEIRPLVLERVLAVVDSEGSAAKRQGVLGCAAALAERFRTEVRLVAPVRPLQREVEIDLEHPRRVLDEGARSLGEIGVPVTHDVRVGAPTRILLEEIEGFRPSVVVLPTLFGHDQEDLESWTLGSVADRVLAAVGVPVLLIEGEVPAPMALFTDLLVLVEEAATAPACLDAAVGLAEKGAAVHLLHVLDQHLVETYRRGIELAAELHTEEAVAAVTRSLCAEMEHYLSGAAAALEKIGQVPRVHVEVGDPIEVTRRRIAEGGHHLLVCNSVAADQKLIDSLAYNLAVYLREVPLLLV